MTNPHYKQGSGLVAARAGRLDVGAAEPAEGHALLLRGCVLLGRQFGKVCKTTTNTHHTHHTQNNTQGRSGWRGRGECDRARLHLPCRGGRCGRQWVRIGRGGGLRLQGPETGLRGGVWVIRLFTHSLTHSLTHE